jgi:hypothetical protein
LQRGPHYASLGFRTLLFADWSVRAGGWRSSVGRASDL